MKRIVIILGMHRSGTSIITQICQYMGVYLGKEKELIEATQDNLSGFFEHKEITSIDDEILRLCNREWYSLEPLKIDFNNPDIIEKIKRLESILSEMFETSDMIGIKDPRMAVLLPLWEKLFDKLADKVTYIWEFRNPLEVAESLKTRNGFSRRHSLLLWINYNLNILKFLKGRKYLLVNYRDILENSHVFYDLSQLLGKRMDDDLIKKLNQLIKHEYCHSDFSNQVIQNECGRVLPDLYDALLSKREQIADITDWSKQYMENISRVEKQYMDYEMLNDIKYLENKELIIYGAGKYGQQAAEMLQQLGFPKFIFCDRDIRKHGMTILGGKVYSITEIEKRENLLIIIAVANENLKKEIEQTLACVKQAKFLSFFALKRAWKYFANDYTKMEMKLEAIADWYQILRNRFVNIKNVYENSILVYQCGKVGSISVWEGLRRADTQSAHIHGFFFKNDIIRQLIFSDDEKDFMSQPSMFYCNFPEYIRQIKGEMKNKKIITMVRDPIAVDLAIVFQWIGSETSDRFFAEQLKQGNSFLQAVLNHMLKVQNYLFNWYDEELKELCGIDVFDYPFDCDKGYTIIKNCDVEILLFKTEKLSQMTEVIRNFTCSPRFEILNENMGKNKEYAYIYEKVKEKLVLPDEYIDFYFKGNPQVSHFYNEAEQKFMRNKWEKRNG